MKDNLQDEITVDTVLTITINCPSHIKTITTLAYGENVL